MSIDIVVTCQTDPARLTTEPFQRTRIVDISVEGRAVTLNCRPAAFELAGEYAELIAQAFGGRIEVDGEEFNDFGAPSLTDSQLVAQWTKLDEAGEAALG